MTRNTLAAFALGALLAPVATAQTSPFLPDALHRALVNEISGDRAFEHVRHLSHFHRTGGSHDFFAATEYLRGAAAAAGLKDVALVRQKWPGAHAWSATSGEAWVRGPEEWKLASYGEIALSVADNSRTTHVKAALVDVGAGVTDADYEGRDVKGKIVLASGAPGKVTELAVWKRGALGIVSSVTNRKEAFDAPDQVAWARVPYEAKGIEGVADGTPGTFAVVISPRRARTLQKLVAAGPVEVAVDIEASFAEPAEQAYVEGYIRGSEPGEPQVVLTAHIQEEMTSANDDGSGCGNLLEIARALDVLIAEGRVPRPRRDIRFWWVNEFSSEEQWFRENPEAPRKMLVALNQDMVGARQSQGGRVQYASRLPWSLPHALDDVMESVLTAVRDGNNELLTMRGQKIPQPFSKEIVAVKGSREPFHARMVPYFGNTDHHAFTPARIGVPATTLTNWPDEFIHSTGDELDNIDATQLERNAVVIAAVAWYFANVGEADAPLLATQVAAGARARAALDLRTAQAHLAQAKPEERAAAFRAARNLVSQAYAKELKALGSVRRFAGKGRAAELVAAFSQRFEGARAADFEALERAFTAFTGQQPPNVALSAEERKMAEEVYAPLKDPVAWESAMDKAKLPSGLHPIVRFEILNLADGRRTTLEVHDVVAAQALSAGAWYYGTVTPAQVKAVLEAAATAGAYTRKGR
ncbi:MAG: M28 family peptidase [Vicinamibacteria bacterium]|nr:M28 family peptidase [Vicinamibacteria bacterium]